MSEGGDDVRGIIDPESGVGIYQSHDVGGHQQRLFNSPRPYDVVSQSSQQVYPPCAEHVVREDEVLLG